MKKDINIFIGSSIVEFEREREQIENFIFSIGQKFRQSYGISVEPLCCENFDDAVSAGRKQEEYNEKIRKSDYCYFLFFTKVGQYTREEFDVAVEKFRVTGKPKIYTYFKELGGETAEETVAEFKNELDKLFGHYYGTFEHIDTVKLRILLNLKLQELDFVEIKIEGNECLVDGRAVLSVENVAEFVNNGILVERKAELEFVNGRYFALKDKFVDGKCSASENRQYFDLASRRQQLIDEIEQLQKDIFNMSLRMCRDEIEGDMSDRHKEAYRLFVTGDLEGTINALPPEEIDRDYRNRNAVLDAAMDEIIEAKKRNVRVYVREYRTRIDALTIKIDYPDRFTEIEEIYDKITAEALEFGVELGTVLDFVWFLYKQNKHQKAYDTAVMLKEIFVDEGKITDSDEIATVYLYLGAVCSDMSSKKDEAEEYHIKAIEIREELARQNPERNNAAFAGSLNNAGVFYKNQGQPEKAEEYYIKAIGIFEELARQNPERFNAVLAGSLNNAGVFYNDQGQAEKAEEYYIKAIAIREELARQNPERFNAVLARSYNNAGTLYSDQGQSKKADEYYIKAIKIFEELARQNPERFIPDLAISLVNVANFYYEHGQTGKAAECYKKAIEIREELTRQNPERFKPDLADSLNNAGVFYKEQGQPEKAEEYYIKAIAIREELARQNPERFNPDLADSLDSAGNFYSDQGQPEKAEEYYIKAVAIREELARQNPERFKPDLADSLNNAGVFYKNQGQPGKAEEYYKKAIEIYEDLAGQNPERFNADLATSYNNAGNFYSDQGQPEKAEEYYIKAIAIREELARQNPERFKPDLADSLNNAGCFYFDQEQPEKAEEYHKKAIAIREELARQNPERFNADLASSLDNAGIFYYEQGQPEKAEEYFIKAVAIREELAKQNPQRFMPDLARSYNNAGNFYSNQGQPEKAEEYYIKAIAIREALARQNPERFNPELAGTYFNFAIFMNDVSYFVKAFELARTVPEHPQCMQIIEMADEWYENSGARKKKPWYKRINSLFKK